MLNRLIAGYFFVLAATGLATPEASKKDVVRTIKLGTYADSIPWGTDPAFEVPVRSKLAPTLFLRYDPRCPTAAKPSGHGRGPKPA
jgi:hypothetical protein